MALPAVSDDWLVALATGGFGHQSSLVTMGLTNSEQEDMMTTATTPLVPPFTSATAIAKVRAAENLWNTREPERVARGGLMRHRHASINDLAIAESDRLFPWDSSGPRPDRHPGLSELGL